MDWSIIGKWLVIVAQNNIEVVISITIMVKNLLCFTVLVLVPNGFYVFQCIDNRTTEYVIEYLW